MKTLTYPKVAKALIVMGSLVVMSAIWLTSPAQAEAVSSETGKTCSGMAVLDKNKQALDMKLMVHRPFGAPIIVLTDI